MIKVPPDAKKLKKNTALTTRTFFNSFTWEIPNILSMKYAKGLSYVNNRDFGEKNKWI